MAFSTGSLFQLPNFITPTPLGKGISTGLLILLSRFLVSSLFDWDILSRVEREEYPGVSGVAQRFHQIINVDSLLGDPGRRFHHFPL
jgi:hypothetical protein